MTQPNPGDGDGKAAPKGPAVKAGDIVSYTRKDPISGAIEELIGVVVRAAEKGLAHLIRPLAHYAHEVDPGDVQQTSADSGS